MKATTQMSVTVNEGGRRVNRYIDIRSPRIFTAINSPDPVLASRTIVVLYAAMPTAPSAYILAARMGGDASFTALLMTVSMLIAAVTLPLWLAALVA